MKDVFKIICYSLGGGVVAAVVTSVSVGVGVAVVVTAVNGKR